MKNSPDELNISEPESTTASTISPEPQRAPATVDPVNEMRAIVIALFVAVLVVSVSFNAYVFKQNKRVQMELDNAINQTTQIEQNPVMLQNRNAMQNLLNEVASQIPAHPEAQQILARYNLTAQAPPPAATPVQPTQPPKQ